MNFYALLQNSTFQTKHTTQHTKQHKIKLYKRNEIKI